MKLQHNKTHHLRLIALALLLLPCHLQAQDTVPISRLYNFICYDSNFLRYDTASASMHELKAKWNRITTTGKGNLNIVHIGGSHVQAGTLPHRVRCNLLTAYPNSVGSRGIIFPYSSAAKCNNPTDYRVHCKERVDLTRNVYKEPQHEMGLCGIAVTAHDSLTTIQIILNEPKFDFTTTRIGIIGESPDHITPLLRAKPRYADPAMEGFTFQPKRYDTTSHRWMFEFNFEVDSFDIVLPCDSAQSFTLRGIQLGSKHNGITYHSIGVNGAAVPDYLKCQHLTRDLQLIHPDLVVFGIGINDAHAHDFDTANFRCNYLQLVDSIRSVNPSCAFIFITNNDSYRKISRKNYRVNSNGPLVRDVCYRLATETGGAVWDQFQIMGGLSSMNQWRIAKLAKYDRVHFTRAGYLLIADLFSNALLKAMKE